MNHATALEGELAELKPRPSTNSILEVNHRFRNFEKEETVTGYGISSPGWLYQQILALRNGTLSAA